MSKLPTNELKRIRRAIQDDSVKREDLIALLRHTEAQEREITELRKEIAAWEEEWRMSGKNNSQVGT